VLLLVAPHLPTVSADNVHAAASPLSQAADGPLQVWNKKDKFYLVIAVDQTGVQGTDLPFTLVDGQRVVQALNSLGYKPLVKGQPLFQNPTRDQVVTALEEIRDFPEWSSVVVYYSGHGVAEPSKQDVWLQLGGQERIKDHLGIAVSEVIDIPRGVSYLGELYVIVDACFSGLGGLTGKLTLRDFGARTAVLTSNVLKGSEKKSEVQFSYPITLPDGTQLSAFTHTFLQGIGPDWSHSDDNGDGILSIEELKTYSRLRLTELFANEKDKQMEPQLVAVHNEERFLAYRHGLVQNWESNARQTLTLVALENSLIPPPTAKVAEAAAKPEIPQAAQVLAKQIPSTIDDPYALGLKAQAQGRLNEAATLLAKAEETEQELARTQREEHEAKLAKIYLARGRNETYAGNYKDALPWYKKAAGLKATRDPELLNEFGLAWLSAGEYEAARSFLQDALTIREKILEAGDPDLAVSLNNLALLYKTQGKYAEAEPLYRRAYAIMKARLGLAHPNTKTVLFSYADLLVRQRNQDEIRALMPDLQAAFQNLITGEKETPRETSP